MLGRATLLFLLASATAAAGCSSGGSMSRGQGLKEPTSNVDAHPSEAETNRPIDATPRSLRVSMSGGWEIPGLKSSRIVKPRTALNVEGLGSSKIHFAVLEPKQEVIAEATRYGLGKDGILYLFPDKWVVHNIKQYDVDGRTFSYVVEASLVRADGRAGDASRHHASASLFFYDEDGNGSFELFEHGWGQTVKTNLPSVPPWARD